MDNTTTAKKENKLEITKEVTVEEVKTVFTLEYLKSQKDAITTQRDMDNAQRDKELEEIDFYLAECVKLGVVAAVAITPEVVEADVPEAEEGDAPTVIKK